MSQKKRWKIIRILFVVFCMLWLYEYMPSQIVRFIKEISHVRTFAVVCGIVTIIITKKFLEWKEKR